MFIFKWYFNFFTLLYIVKKIHKTLAVLIRKFHTISYRMHLISAILMRINIDRSISSSALSAQNLILGIYSLPLFSYVSACDCARRQAWATGMRGNWREQPGQMWSRSCRWLNGLIKRLIYLHARCNVTLRESYSQLRSIDRAQIAAREYSLLRETWSIMWRDDPTKSFMPI